MPALPVIADATLPASYEHAKDALAKCDRVDECKTWADKAMALASYAKQADDDTLHRLATRISARAIRRCGELLKEFDARGRPENKPGTKDIYSQRQAAANAGMSKHQQVQATQVANVPADEFELAVEAEQPATITQLADMGKTARPAPPGFKAATHAINTVKDFAAFCAVNAPAVVAGGVYAYEVSQVRKHVAAINAWLDAFVSHLKMED